ncbi:MAG: DnaB-like helicase N-terminal domain-containing protein [Phycisphaerae bacterium]
MILPSNPRGIANLPHARDGALPLPHDEAGERNVIASILIDPDCFNDVAEILPTPGAFFGLLPQAIYGAMLALQSAGDPIDIYTVWARLRESGYPRLDDAYAYLTEALHSLPSAANALTYAKAVAELCERRRLSLALRNALSGLQSGATRESVLATLDAESQVSEPAVQEEKRRPMMHSAAYHGVAGEWVRLIDPHTEADPAATLLQFLIAFGNAAGRRAHFHIGATKHYLNLFGCLIGATNAGRKGTSLEGALLPIRLIDEAWGDRCQATGLSSGEGLIDAVRDPQVQADHIIDAGVQDKRLLVIETELAAPMQRMGRDGNTLSTIVRQAWDGGRLRTMTKGSPMRATDAHISIIAHITPEELRRLLTANEQTNGFANRFLWCFVHRSKYLPFGGRIDEALLDPIRGHLMDALEFAAQPREITMSADAAAAWEGYYRQLTADLPGVVGAMTARGAPMVRRLACIYSCLDFSEKVELVHLEAAMAVWNHCRESVEYIFGDWESSDLDALIDWIAARGGSVTVREVGKFAPRRYRRNAEQWIEKLIASGQGKWDIPDNDGSGRPPKIFRLAAAAAAAKSRESPEKTNNAAAASAASVATAADSADDMT